MTTIHQMKLRANPFEKIKNGKKTIELRLYDEKRKQIVPDDIIVFTNIENGEKISAVVKKLWLFDSFKKLFEALPKVKLGYSESEEASYTDMEAYYSLEEQSKFGVVGIEISIVDVGDGGKG